MLLNFLVLILKYISLISVDVYKKQTCYSTVVSQHFSHVAVAQRILNISLTIILCQILIIFKHNN